MAKKVTGYIKLQIPAGKATPAPPVGPALGQHGVNIVEFTKQFNAKTADQGDLIIPVVITVYADRSFSFITKYFFWGKRLNDKDTDDRKCRASEPLCAGTDGRGNRPAISSVMQGTGSRASVHGNDQCKGAPV